MAMCPDRNQLVAFADCELAEPWKGRIVRHLAACGACSRQLERYRQISDYIRAHADNHPEVDQYDFDRAEDALRERLAPILEKDYALLAHTADNRNSLLKRRFLVSVPLAAALFIGLVAGGGFAGVALTGGNSRASYPIASNEIVKSPMQLTSMDELVRYLDAQNSQVAIIELPRDATLGMTGKPVVFRASQLGLQPSAQITSQPTIVPVTDQGSGQ